MTAPLPTREEIAAILYDAHEVAWRGVVQHHIPWKDVSGQQRGSYLVMADALLARLRPAFDRLEHLEACDKADPYETRRQLAMRIDALQAELAATKERARWEDEGLVLPLREQIQELSKRLFTANASLARKDEALRACAEALTRSDSLLSLLRHRLANTIPWNTPGMPSSAHVDEVIGQSRAALDRAQEAGR